MNKRGAYFFVIDALIAASVIFISLIIIFTSHRMVPESSPSLRMIEDYMDFLTTTKVNQFQGGYVTSLNITGSDNTLLEQLAEFYYYNTTGNDTSQIMWNFTREISKGIIPDQRGLVVYINDRINNRSSLVYNRSVSPMEKSSLVLSSKRVIFKRITNETNDFIFGPVILDIRVWV
jgi:hypothetical protein